jgi:uncharacterized membrane protein YphA (DoxX/SURF4 family)
MIGRILTGRLLNLVLRLGLGGIFLYAAVEKVLHPASFAIAVRGYKLVPFAYSNLFAIAMSWSEFVAASMLILGILTRKAAAAVFILLVAFIVAITTVLVRGMVVDCGCFGAGGSSTSWLLIARNLLLLAAAYLVVRYNDGWLGLFPLRRGTR